MVGIYKITNPKNAIYIGQSIDIIKRFNSYKVLDCKNQKKLYHSLKKYGFENHKFEIITECDIDQLNNLERYYQDLYNVLDNKFGLNCKLTASNDRSGKHSDDIKNKISIAHTGKKKPYMIERNKKYIGKKASDETKLKMSIAQTGRKASDETRKKLSEVKKGKKMSDEFCKKNSEAKKKLYANGYVNPFSKMVIDLETGFVYYSSMEAWQHNKDYLKVGASCFRAKLLGKIKNNTKFIYA